MNTEPEPRPADMRIPSYLLEYLGMPLPNATGSIRTFTSTHIFLVGYIRMYESRPSNKHLAKLMKVSERYVCRLICECIEIGVIESEDAK